MVSFKGDKGVFTVTLPEASKFDAAAVKKAVGRFSLDQMNLKIKGEVSRDDKGLWLTAPSGAKVQLANRPKKDDKDTPPDVVAKIEEGMKSGITTFAVAGAVKAEKEATIVHLDSAQAVEKKKE
jgi:hypothetical protein